MNEELEYRVDQLIRLREFERGLSGQLKQIRQDMKIIEDELALVVETNGDSAEIGGVILDVFHGQSFDKDGAHEMFPMDEYPQAYSISKATLASVMGTKVADTFMRKNPDAQKLNIRPKPLS